MTDIQWTIPSTVYKDYQPSLNTAAIVPLADADKKAKTISFYWSDPGTKDVSVTFKVGSGTCKQSATLTALAPTVTGLQSPMGTTKYGSIPDGQGNMVAGIFLLGAIPQLPNTIPGILFGATLSMPSGFTGGKWQFLSLIHQHSIQRSLDQQQCAEFNTGNYWLDKKLYVPPVDPVNDPVPYPANGQPHQAFDNPGIRTAQISAGKMFPQNFKVYLIFMPPGNDSTWVALKVLDYGHSFCGVSGNPWTVSSITRIPPTGNPPYSDIPGNKQPVWTKNYVDLTGSLVNCPSPFCG
jgi:hypothetical protein